MHCCCGQHLLLLTWELLDACWEAWKSCRILQVATTNQHTHNERNFELSAWPKWKQTNQISSGRLISFRRCLRDLHLHLSMFLFVVVADAANTWAGCNLHSTRCSICCQLLIMMSQSCWPAAAASDGSETSRFAKSAVSLPGRAKVATSSTNSQPAN